MKKNEILQSLKQGLIVSCQALEDEPLHSAYIMSRMAYAAAEGGACGIRANTVADIKAIRTETDLPIIGIIKKEYPDSEVYITPTAHEVDALVAAGVEIIAIDATGRPRPYEETLEEFFRPVREKYPDQLFMADTSCLEEGLLAERLGFDLIGTTMSGYTPYTAGRSLPDLELIEAYAARLSVPVVAEGGIWTPQQLKAVFQAGAYTAVVGTAITRPREITKRFVAALEEIQ